MESFVHLRKGRTPQRMHADLDGLKDDELGRGGFTGRTATLYRSNDPTAFRAVGRIADLVAPVLPVLGVAASWGRGTDPAYEITAATPRAGLQLVFRRTAAVLVVVIPVLLAAGWATGMTPWLWLLPCLAFTTGTLALGRALGMFRAVASLIAVWAGVIVAPTLAQDRVSFALRPEALPVWAAICALGLAVVVLRRADFTLLTTRP